MKKSVLIRASNIIEERLRFVVQGLSSHVYKEKMNPDNAPSCPTNL